MTETRSAGAESESCSLWNFFLKIKEEFQVFIRPKEISGIALHRGGQMMKLDINLKKIELEIQPHVLAGILQLDDRSDMNFTELDRLIKSDANMSAVILKASNSSFYYRGIPIKNLQQAIARLGFHVVRSLAIVAASRKLFEAARYSRFKHHVFDHSLSAAVISRKVVDRMNRSDLKEDVFVAGLLHDIAKVVMNLVDRKKFIEVLDLVTEHDLPFHEAETKVFGYNHHQVGEKISSEWNFPEIYGPILSGHSDPDPKPGESGEMMYLRRTVGYSNCLAKLYGFGHINSSLGEEISVYEKILELGPEDVTYFQNDLRRTFREDEEYKYMASLI